MYMGLIDFSQLSVGGVTPLTQGSTGIANSPVRRQSGFDKLLTSLPDLIGAGLTLANAQKLANLNFQRIRQGLTPLSPEQAAVPAGRVSVGLDKSTSNMLMYGGMALVGVMLLITFGKKRR